MVTYLVGWTVLDALFETDGILSLVALRGIGVKVSVVLRKGK